MISGKTLGFLAENRFRNDKLWFKENQDKYVSFVIEPMKQLLCEIAPAVKSIDRLIVTEPYNRVLSRIYCDMRYSHGVMFREQMWFSLRRDKNEYPGYPEIFFVVSPSGFLLGCGNYTVTSDFKESICRLIVSDDALSLEAMRDYGNQSFFSLTGDLYKRAKYPGQPEKKRQWLERKNICLCHESADFTLLFAENLGEILSGEIVKLGSFYRLLVKARESL